MGRPWTDHRDPETFLATESPIDHSASELQTETSAVNKAIAKLAESLAEDFRDHAPFAFRDSFVRAFNNISMPTMRAEVRDGPPSYNSLLNDTEAGMPPSYNQVVNASQPTGEATKTGTSTILAALSSILAFAQRNVSSL
jgi:hypothetical protein